MRPDADADGDAAGRTDAHRDAHAHVDADAGADADADANPDARGNGNGDAHVDRDGAARKHSDADGRTRLTLRAPALSCASDARRTHRRASRRAGGAPPAVRATGALDRVGGSAYNRGDGYIRVIAST